MEPLQAQTEDHIEINQTRQRFVDLVSPGEQLLCNILIYCSCYYPRTKGLLRDVLNNVWINDPLRLLAAIDHLYECFLR